MELCTACLHADEREVQHCPSCGGTEFAELNKHGHVVTVPASEMPCSECLEAGHDLKFRAYRRVIAYLFGASIHQVAGYLCSSCRRRMFLKWQGLTFLLGWWGIFSFWLYNPHALLVNFWALFRPPFDPGTKGAITVNELRSAAAEDQRLEDVYMSMPLWLEHLTEDELDLVTSGNDYYGALDIDGEADPAEVKRGYREMAKRFHPDSGGAGADATVMAEINEAYRVLGDARLRYAYDHVDELFDVIDEFDPPAPDPEWACRACGETFLTWEEALAHADANHVELRFEDAKAALLKI